MICSFFSISKSSGRGKKKISKEMLPPKIAFYNCPVIHFVGNIITKFVLIKTSILFTNYLLPVSNFENVNLSTKYILPFSK